MSRRTYPLVDDRRPDWFRGIRREWFNSESELSPDSLMYSSLTWAEMEAMAFAHAIKANARDVLRYQVRRRRRKSQVQRRAA